MLRRTLAGLLIAALLAGCGGEAATTAPAVPTIPPTAAAIALADIDLEALALQDGDLPAGYSGAQASDKAPGMFDKVLAPIKAFDRRFQKDNANAGGVTILLYATADDAITGYADTFKGMTDDNTSADIGDRAAIGAINNEVINAIDGMFRRCNAVVFVRFADMKSAEPATAYMRRLDTRLQPLVCP